MATFFESIEPPPGAEAYGTSSQGIVLLLNNILKIAIFSAGLVALVNLLISGIQYIGSSGNPEILKKASSRIWISLLGLVIIASSVALAALIGLILFGDSGAILNPQLPGAQPSGDPL